MRRSIVTRGIATLCTASFLATGLGFWVHDRIFTQTSSTSPVAAYLELRHPGPIGMVETHFRSVQERYEALSSTPQFRANLEVDHAPTLAHFASELLRKQRAERILFRDALRVHKASAGRDDLDTHIVSSLASELVTEDGRIFAIAHVPLGTASHPVGDLIAAEAVGQETIAGWSRAEQRANSDRRRSLIGGGVLAIFAALVASLVVWRSLLVPLRRLADVATRIGAGDFTARIAEHRNDEIGDVSMALDQMAERLEHYDDDLNAQVASRTAELAEALERAEEANRLRAELLARVSHEFRTPMNSIFGMMELLVRSDPDPERSRLIESVDQSGRALLRLINGMLDISANETGGLSLATTDFDLLEAIESATRRLEPVAHGKGLEVSCNIGPDVPEYVHADGKRLVEVLEILLDNAIKFTERGAVRLDVSNRPETRKLRFEVRDTGMGVARCDIEHIFEPFTQLDGSSRRLQKGAGLGLPLASSLVELMGGRIEIESEVGEGSTFSFELPLAPAARPRQATLPDPSSQRATEADVRTPATETVDARILLAEDNPLNRELASQNLQGRGWLVDTASNGMEAVAAAAEVSYAAILMDVQMPGMDGLEATRAIRAQEVRERAPRVPIIALTANALVGGDRTFFDAGMDDYLSKPYRGAELDDKLTVWARALPEAPAPTPQTSTKGRSGATSSNSILEPEVLAELRALDNGGNAVISHLIDVYLRSMPELLESLREAVMGGDAQEAERLAHQLKSSAANVAARGLAELFRHVESQAATREITKELETTLVEIEETFELVRAELLRERG